MSVLLLGLFLLQAQATRSQQRGAASRPVQIGVAVQPETVTVGQHFSATLRVRVPTGSTVRFPASADSTSQVDTVSAPVRHDVDGAGYTESTVVYPLAAWDTGSQSVGLDDVVVATPAGERVASLGALRVYVRSVLPADTALRKPKPFRPLIAIRPFDWLPWIIAAALVALLALIGLLVFAWRHWRRHVNRPLTAFEWAQREFARIDSQRFLESGETERYAIAMSDVLREYLYRLLPIAAPSLTTRELAIALRGAAMPPIAPDRAIDLFERIDLLKFAAGRMSAESAMAAGADARAIIAEFEDAMERSRAAAARSKAA